MKQSFIFDNGKFDISYYQYPNSYQEDQRHMALIFFCRFGFALCFWKLSLDRGNPLSNGI
jgi:hypothetical protein